ncbi:MAG: hypothetical protein ACRYHQ_04210 [Janthinobacterium lividum]
MHLVTRVADDGLGDSATAGGDDLLALHVGREVRAGQASPERVADGARAVPARCEQVMSLTLNVTSPTAVSGDVSVRVPRPHMSDFHQVGTNGADYHR